MRIRDLHFSYPGHRGLNETWNLHNICLDLRRGRTLGLVGESGCGKSSLGRLCVALMRPDSGQMILADSLDIAKASKRQLKAIRPRLQMIFQDPYSSFNPRMKVARSFACLRSLVETKDNVEKFDSRLASMLQAVNLDMSLLNRRPAQLSGGQLQRLSIARALMVNPQLLVADEITASLDLPIQHQIVELLKRLQEIYQFSLIFISHDLSAVCAVADEIAVMSQGRIIEKGTLSSIISDPKSAITRELIEAIPDFPYTIE